MKWQKRTSFRYFTVCSIFCSRESSDTVWVRLRYEVSETLPSPRKATYIWVLKGIERAKNAQGHTVVREIPGAGVLLTGRGEMRVESCPEGFRALSILAEKGSVPAARGSLAVLHSHV